MSRTLYLGKAYDPEASSLGSRIELESSDLLTHGLIVGMTGSGKTGLAIALVEEVLRQGTPVLAIDPKGDLGNLLLLFDDPAPASSSPWIDGEAVARWRSGLAEWGLTANDVAALKRAHEATLYTPGSSAGRSLNVLQSLEAPGVDFESAEEELRDEIAGIVSGMLGLLRIEADPLQSRESLLLANLIENAWRAGRGLTLESLIAAVADPPFDKVGALPLESAYPKRDRQSLMLALNTLLASPSFESWREGDPLDVESLLFTEDRKPRLSIVYTAHLQDHERLFVTALLLDKLKTWVRRQSGTSELRALVYMDEIFGYFPPHPANPPTKRPLLTLLKQARAQGVGIVLATQNPVDLDYKALANIGLWLVGHLQTDQDRARLRDGLVGSGADAKAIDRLLGAAKKRVFLLHDVHRSGPCLLHSRWTLSYLRGPLTREEVAWLMKARPEQPIPKAQSAGDAGPPPLPAPFRHSYYSKYGGELADLCLLVKYAVRYKGADESVALRAYPLSAQSAAESLESESIEIDEAALAAEPPAGLRFGEVPELLAGAGAKGIERALRERLADKLALAQLFDPVTNTSSRPGENRQAFAARLGEGGGGPAAAKLSEQIEKKRRALGIKDQEAKGRETEKWASLGSAAISVLGGMLGASRRVSRLSKAMGGLQKAGSILSKNRLETTAEARVDALQDEITALEEQLQELACVDPARFEERELVPAKTDVKILRYDVVWVY